MSKKPNAESVRYNKTQKVAAGAAKKNGIATPTKGLRRFTHDNELIYRPSQYPFEIVSGYGYIVQTECFTDYGETINSGLIGSSYATSDAPDEVNVTNMALQARTFDTCEEALEFINRRGDQFEVGEDGNVYPRVLKVRMSCIVEGVAFEPVMHNVEGGVKIEGVA